MEQVRGGRAGGLQGMINIVPTQLIDTSTKDDQQAHVYKARIKVYYRICTLHHNHYLPHELMISVLLALSYS